MKSLQNFTAIIEREDGGYVALCPDWAVASQGDTIEQAKESLQEAIELFFEYASKKEEITLRLNSGDKDFANNHSSV